MAQQGPVFKKDTQNPEKTTSGVFLRIKKGMGKVVLVVPKKSFPTAVERNYIKRCIKEVFRLLKKSGSYDTLMGQNDITVSVSKTKDRLDYKYLLEKIKNTLNNA